MKAIRIDPTARTVTLMDYAGLEDLQKGVADSQGSDTICLAGYIGTDTVYINDDGLFLFSTFFELPCCGQGLFAGPAMLVGPEIGDTANTRDPKTTVEEVTSKIKWYNRTSARARAGVLGI